jgi:hypothetical protein
MQLSNDQQEILNLIWQTSQKNLIAILYERVFTCENNFKKIVHEENGKIVFIFYYREEDEGKTIFIEEMHCLTENPYVVFKFIRSITKKYKYLKAQTNRYNFRMYDFLDKMGATITERNASQYDAFLEVNYGKWKLKKTLKKETK